MVTKSIICPLTGPSDRIQKVSSVYTEGTSYTEETSSYSSTTLAMSLAPPAMPKLRNFTGWYVAVTLCTIALFFAPVPSRAKIWYVGYLVIMYPSLRVEEEEEKQEKSKLKNGLVVK